MGRACFGFAVYANDGDADVLVVVVWLFMKLSDCEFETVVVPLLLDNKGLANITDWKAGFCCDCDFICTVWGLAVWMNWG